MTIDAGVVDLILLLVGLEVLALLAWRALRGGGLAPPDFLFNLLAGAALMLALRAALSGAGSAWIGAALALALVMHAADLWRRWQSSADTRSVGKR
ncbi:MAG: hypothetical protein MUC71_07180 [Steroidobacteraceae bacterium]|nr:hypothetical protein [Steroidobacteraceae bacterium]